MVDNGASHNYLASSEVARLGLMLEKATGRVKAINSAAQPLVGVVKECTVRAGAFITTMDVHVLEMDDFGLILGMDFLRESRITIFSHGNALLVMGDKPCIIRTTEGPSADRKMSAL